MVQGVDIDLRSLLKAYLAPIADQVDLDGRCSFALFLQQIAIQSGAWTGTAHPLASKTESGTLRLFGMICSAIPNVNRLKVADRLIRLMHLPLQFFGEEGSKISGDDPSRASSFEDILAMMAAALSV